MVTLGWVEALQPPTSVNAASGMGSYNPCANFAKQIKRHINQQVRHIIHLVAIFSSLSIADLFRTYRRYVPFMGG
jgi:hypothetical protein